MFPLNSSLLPRPTLWSRSEREKQIPYTNAYIWNLEDGADEPIYRKKWRPNVENELVDTVGEGEGRTNSESSADIYTLSCEK